MIYQKQKKHNTKSNTQVGAGLPFFGRLGQATADPPLRLRPVLGMPRAGAGDTETRRGWDFSLAPLPESQNYEKRRLMIHTPRIPTNTTPTANNTTGAGLGL